MAHFAFSAFYNRCFNSQCRKLHFARILKQSYVAVYKHYIFENADNWNNSSKTNKKTYKMKTYRFILEKYNSISSRHTCPECKQKKCFVKYIDIEGVISFPDYVGRCNREEKCSYHFTPKQYFELNPLVGSVTKNYNTDKELKVPIPINYLSKTTVRESLKYYDRNNLFQYMKFQFGSLITLNVFAKYQVGTANFWNGATVFWQIDELDKVRTGKIMLYDSTTGKRVKHPHNHITWVHSLMHNEKYNLKQCFFGEHLLKVDNSLPIAIVESEKSAIIASCYLPQYLWMATGGKYGCFNPENFEKFIGRKVVLFPDLGALELWQLKANQMQELGIEIAIFDYLERNATEEQIKEGYDIADFLLQIKPQEAIIQTLIQNNPILQDLIEDLDLEIDLNSSLFFP